MKIDLGKGGYLSVTHERSEMPLIEPYDEQDVTFTLKNTGDETITIGDIISLENGVNDKNEWQAVKEIPYTGKKELAPDESAEFILRYKDAYPEGKEFFNGRMAVEFTCDGGSYKAYSVFGIQGDIYAGALGE